MASVIDSLMVTLGLDPSAFKKGVQEVNNNLQQMNSAIKQTGGEVAQLGSKWGGTLSGMVRSIAGPLLAGASLGAMVKSYTSDVSKVAKMTWAYNDALDEERKRKAMLQRVTKEDLVLYKHSREAMTKFEIATADLSATFMRSFHPAMKFAVDMLNRLSDWISRNQNNITRFLLVVGSIVSVTLIPAFRKWAAAILANPLTWLVVALGAVALAIDDLVVYMQGGKSAFAKFWAQFGTGEELMRKFKAIWQQMLDGFEKFKTYLPTIGRAIAMLAGLKLASMGIASVTNSFKALGAFLSRNVFLMAIMAIAFAISDLITYIKGGESALSGLWSVFGTGKEVGDALASTWEWLKDTFNANRQAIVGVTAGFAGLFAAFKTISVVSTLAGKAVSTFAVGFKALGVGVTMLKGLATAIRVVTLAMAANPIMAAIMAVIAAIVLLVANWDKVKEVAGNVADYIKAKWEAFKGWFKSLGDSFPEVWKNLKASFTEWVGGIASEIGKAFDDAAKTVKNIWDDVANWFRDKFAWITGQIESVTKIASKIGDAVSDGWDATKNFFGWGNNEEKEEASKPKKREQAEPVEQQGRAERKATPPVDQQNSPERATPARQALQPYTSPVPTREQLTQAQIPAAAQINNNTETRVTSTTNINGMVINSQATDAAGIARDIPTALKNSMPGYVPATSGVFQ